MPSKKSLKNGAGFEDRLQFYSLLTRKTAAYLENILGKQTFNSLQNCELSSQEIESINQDLITIIQSEQEDVDKNHPILQGLQNHKVILLRPELAICSELVLEFLLSQKLAIASVFELSLKTSEFLEIFKLKFNQSPNLSNLLPTSIINFMHSPAKVIYLKEALSQDNQDFIQKNIVQKEYEILASMFGPRITTILDPLKYIQNVYLGLIQGSGLTIDKSYLQTLQESVRLY
ncbi:MAG: hypothetical protein WCK98_06380 [bacterium]